MGRESPQPGKPPTLAELYDVHAPGLYAYACLLARTPTEAEDIVQNCFVRLAGREDHLATVGNVRGYLLAVCRHEAFNYRSRWRRWWQGDVACGTGRLVNPPDETGLAEDEAAKVRQALGRLPPLQREAVFLKIWQGLTFAEIAELVNVSPNTAAGRYRYGIEKLKGLLDDDDE